MQKQVSLFSEILDTEFELFNINGFSNQRASIPGSSSWDYKIAIIVKPKDIVKWTENMKDTIFINYNTSWTSEIIRHRKIYWKINSLPKYYYRKGEDVTMLVYEPEGVIFKRIINN